MSTGNEIERLIQILARLPGLGPRSARRAALFLIKRREGLLMPLHAALQAVCDSIRPCSVCGSYDSTDPCSICADPARDSSLLCVVEDVSGVWAFERSAAYKGRYHVLGGVLSALDGIGPDELNVDALMERAADPQVSEIILALGATVDGQTTAHYLADRLEGCRAMLSRLALGVPIGGELDYLDEGTLETALRARRPL